MRRLWAALNVILRGRLTGFSDIGRHFSKICTETFKRNVHNPKQRRPPFQKMKNCFFNNWYCISQIHDLKPIIKRSFRQPAQPKHDSAFNEKHVLLQVERSQQVLKTAFLFTTKESSPPELKKTFFGKYSTSFWKVSILLKKQKLFL